MMNELAPIALSTYSRLEHLKQTVSALQQNTLAIDSDLYIFSDGPKSGDEVKVIQLRKYLHTITGFKNVYIFEREINNRIANNRGGMKMLLEKFGKMIFIEEDAVCASSFLQFMNDALITYYDDQRVFAINGYFPEIKLPKSYTHDVLMVPRMNAWAFGIWQDRFNKIEMGSTPEMYHSIFNNRSNFRKYGRGGLIVYSQLDALSKGLVDGLDIRIDYTMFKLGGLYTVRPTKSLVLPIGCDGSGEHWNYATNRYDVSVNHDKVFTNPDISPNLKIIKKFKQFNDVVVPLYLKVFLRLHTIGLYNLAKKIRNFFRKTKNTE